MNVSCTFTELSPVDSYNKIKEELIRTYPSNGESLIIEINNKDNFTFQVTTTANEMDALHSQSTLPILDLGECEQTLKEENDIDDNEALIILKYGKTTGHTNEKNIQYEIIDPNSFDDLDLSVCDNGIYVYVPITLDEQSQELYNEVKEQDYFLLDIKSDFYNDVCTPFFSQKGTDVILNDRIIYYYSKIASDANCPQNCQLLNYLSENNKLKCSCGINTNSINTENSGSVNTYNLNDYNNYLNDFKYSSYKTMKCSNLVFNSKIFRKNYGAILTLLLFAGYLSFMGLYFYKNISPLKVEISKILSEDNTNNKFNLFDMEIKKIQKKKKNEKKENKDKEKKSSKINKKANPPKNIQIGNNPKPKKLNLRKNINNFFNNGDIIRINNINDIDLEKIENEDNNKNKSISVDKTIKTRNENNINMNIDTQINKTININKNIIINKKEKNVKFQNKVINRNISMDNINKNNNASNKPKLIIKNNNNFLGKNDMIEKNILNKSSIINENKKIDDINKNTNTKNKPKLIIKSFKINNTSKNVIFLNNNINKSYIETKNNIDKIKPKLILKRDIMDNKEKNALIQKIGMDKINDINQKKSTNNIISNIDINNKPKLILKNDKINNNEKDDSAKNNDKNKSDTVNQNNYNDNKNKNNIVISKPILIIKNNIIDNTDKKNIPVNKNINKNNITNNNRKQPIIKNNIINTTFVDINNKLDNNVNNKSATINKNDISLNVINKNNQNILNNCFIDDKDNNKINNDDNKNKKKIKIVIDSGNIIANDANDINKNDNDLNNIKKILITKNYNINKVNNKSVINTNINLIDGTNEENELKNLKKLNIEKNNKNKNTYKINNNNDNANNNNQSGNYANNNIDLEINKVKNKKNNEKLIINKNNNENKNKINIEKYFKKRSIHNKMNKKEGVEVHSMKSNDSLNRKAKENIETEKIINTKTKFELKEEEKLDEINNTDLKSLDNYELYKLDFLDAVALDKRNFTSIYLSLIKREELIMLTFVSWNDYNLFYVKIDRFLFLFVTTLVMNSLLFADKTIHKLYLEEGKYNFGQSLPQIIYSLLITHVIEILLCFLTMTDRHIYEIKALKKTKEYHEKIFEIMKLMRIKLIVFYTSTSAIFIFYWYCVSAFCAVYQKTQGFLILNAFLCFFILLIDPFIVYGIIALMRILSLKYSNKKGMKWMYSISKFFHIF